MAKSSSTAWPSSESAHLAESIDFGSRPSSSEDHLDIYPPPYDSWKSHDPRSSSTQSLVPSISDHDEHRRTLLIVYIHGFMGNDSSFRSFPAHVHHYLKAALAETHVIHSKIYPRYKTYKAIDVARENFSKWLEPHESETTDVILIGHSMGGLLAADVVLIPSSNPVYGHPFRHRILGSISLDAPLLGLHPGIVVSGITSLFRKAPDPPGREQEIGGSSTAQSTNASGTISPIGSPPLSPETSNYLAGQTHSGVASPVPLTSVSSITSTLNNQAEPDPNFNPAFHNDVKFVDRGWLRNVAHFAQKHKSEGIFNSAYNHIASHLEFGSCLADYAGLNNRYDKLRRLEDVDDYGANINGPGRQARVRFVNYFTISTGIPKKPATPKEPSAPKRADTHLKPALPERPSLDGGGSASGTSTPRISIEDYSDSERPTLLQLEPIPEPIEEQEQPGSRQRPGPDNENGKPTVLQTTKEDDDSDSFRSAVEKHDSNTPRSPKEDTPGGSTSQPTQELAETKDEESEFPPILPLPSPPQFPDLGRYTDKEARKQAEKEGKRALKAYEQAVKNRDKAIKERQKLVEKRRKKSLKDAEKLEREEQKRKLKQEQEEQKRVQEEQKRMAREEKEAEQKRLELEKKEQAQIQMLQKQLSDLSTQDSSLTTLESNATQGSVEKGKGADQRTKEKEKKKEKKFCMLPRKTNGARDATWVQVYMEGVDEVGAHCGLFFMGPHYEKLVGDVGARIVGWVHEDLNKRAALGGYGGH